MKEVLVTGSDGMLGSELVRQLRRIKGVRLHALTQKDMDIVDLEAVKRTLESIRPTHIVHCAAFTQVDTAEKDPLIAYRVNAGGTKNLAFFARELGAEMIYVSTDYVFAGEKKKPYLETDKPSPINVYGNSKLKGEEAVRILCERHKIIRTSWLNGLGGMHGRNFIETMIRVSETRSQLSVVNDQIGRPTFTFDLAAALINLLDVQAYGVFHVTNQGQCSWYDLAQKIFELAKRDVTVRPISSDQFQSIARRPRFSVLANTRFEKLGIPQLPEWEDSLVEYWRRRRLAESIRRPESRAPSPDAKRAE